MNSRERVLCALNHQEADRIPFDLGGTGATGIHLTAYRNLREYLGLPAVEIRLEDIIQQLAVVDEDVAQRLQTDCRNVAPRSSAIYNLVLRDEGDYTAYTDEWGIDWRMPKARGFYYDMYRHPMAQAEAIADIKDYAWPDATDPHRFEGLQERAKAVHDQGKIVILGGLCAGVTEMHAWLRGFEQYYTDFYLHPEVAEYIMDKVVELKMAYWESALKEAGEYVDVVMEADDMAGQNRLFFSPDIYRKFVKPCHTRLFAFIKQQARVKIFFHTCGAIRPLIGDLIESGIDILNPVQKSAFGMDLAELKRDFGKDVVFWGGGVDTQHVFDSRAPQEVRADVKRSIEALAPGGGFVFATVHNTQANVPPENFIAMWETLQEYSLSSESSLSNIEVG
jgi:uroporphyrinogen decarboxylase